MTEATITRTGVIGLGAMGLQMARHMAAKGFEVYGADIDQDAVRRASAHGVRPCGSAAAVGERAEIIVVMVATDAQVEDVIRASGLLDRLRPGAVICISSSVAPQTCRDLAATAAAREIGVIDTPVVLGQDAANKGELTVYAGGEARWVERARPALSAFGRKIIHVGAVGSGQIAKTMNNLLLWANMCANFEVLTLAKALDAEVPMPLAGLVDQLAKSINQDKMRALLA